MFIKQNVRIIKHIGISIASYKFRGVVMYFGVFASATIEIWVFV